MISAISFSSLQAYNLCEYRFWFLYYKRLGSSLDSKPAAIGNIVHAEGEALLEELTSVATYNEARRLTVLRKYQAIVSAGMKELGKRMNINPSDVQIALDGIELLSRRSYIVGDPSKIYDIPDATKPTEKVLYLNPRYVEIAQGGPGYDVDPTSNVTLIPMRRVEVPSDAQYTVVKKVIAKELRFEKILENGAHITGSVDLVLENQVVPNEITLIDLKSGKKFGTASYKTDQLIIYQLAVSPDYPTKTVKLAYDFFMKSDELLEVVPHVTSQKRVSDQLLKAYDYLTGSGKGTAQFQEQAGTFNTNSNRRCKECPAFLVCPDEEIVRQRQSPDVPPPGSLFYRRVLPDKNRKKGNFFRDSGEEDKIMRDLIYGIIITGGDFQKAIASINSDDKSVTNKQKRDELFKLYIKYTEERKKEQTKDKQGDERARKRTNIQIGAIHVSSPVTNIVASDQKQFSQYDTLRTKEAMTIREQGANREANISITFSGVDAINYELRHILAQYQAFPFVQIRNADLTRLLLPVQSHLPTYYAVDDKTVRKILKAGNTTKDFAKIEDWANYQTSLEQREELYSKMRFMYAIKSLQIAPVQSMVDTLELTLRVQIMDLDPVSETGTIRFIYDTQSALEQLGWFTHYCRMNEYRQSDVIGGKSPVDIIVPKSKGLQLVIDNIDNVRRANIDLNERKYDTIAMPLHYSANNAGDPLYNTHGVHLDEDAHIVLMRVGNVPLPAKGSTSPKQATADAYHYLPFLYTRGILLPLLGKAEKVYDSNPNLASINAFVPSLKPSFFMCTKYAQYFSNRPNDMTAYGKFTPNSNLQSTSDTRFLLFDNLLRDPIIGMIEYMQGLASQNTNAPLYESALKMNEEQSMGEWLYTSPVAPIVADGRREFRTDIEEHIIKFSGPQIKAGELEQRLKRLFCSAEVFVQTGLERQISTHKKSSFAAKNNKALDKNAEKVFDKLFVLASEREFSSFTAAKELDIMKFTKDPTVPIYLPGSTTPQFARILSLSFVGRNNSVLSQHKILVLTNPNGTTLKSNMGYFEFPKLEPDKGEIKGRGTTVKVGTAGTFLVMPPILNHVYATRLAIQHQKRAKRFTEVYPTSTSVRGRIRYASLAYVVGTRNNVYKTPMSSDATRVWIKMATEPSAYQKLYNYINRTYANGMLSAIFCGKMRREGIPKKKYTEILKAMLYENEWMSIVLNDKDADKIIETCTRNYDNIYGRREKVDPEQVRAKREQLIKDAITIEGQGNNPVQQTFTVDTMSLSRPYIKYYTSMLAEYNHPGEYWDVAKRIPDYLRFTPYEQINQFPLMLPYEKSGLETGSKNEILFLFRSLRKTSFTGTDEEQFNRAALRTVNDTVMVGMRDLIANFLPGTSDEYRNMINTAAAVANADPDTGGLFAPGECSDCKCPTNIELKRYIDAHLRRKISKIGENLLKYISATKKNKNTRGQATLAFRALISSVGKTVNGYHEMVTGTGRAGLPEERNIRTFVRENGVVSDPATEGIKGGSFKSFLYIATYLGGLLYLVVDKIDNFIKNHDGIASYNMKQKLKVTKDVLYFIISNKTANTDGIISQINVHLKRTDKADTRQREVSRGEQAGMSRKTGANLNTDLERMRKANAIDALARQVLPFVISAAAIRTGRDVSVKINKDNTAIKNLSDSTIITNAVADQDSLHFVLEKANILSSDNLDLRGQSLEYHVGVLKNSLMSSVLTLFDSFLPDPFKWKDLKIANSNIGESSRNKKSTSITSFTIAQENNIVPIYMEGHENPFPQSLGGSNTMLTIEIVTDDIFLMENIAEAATELNIMMRKYNIAKNVNPLRRPLGTGPESSVHKQILANLGKDATRRRIAYKILSATGSVEPDITRRGIDTPILIKNNIANMLGIYGCAITDIQYQTVQDKANTFLVKLSMKGVDINQTDRETPRRADATYDRALLTMECCTVPSYVVNGSLNSDADKILLANIAGKGERITGKLVILALLANLDKAYTSLQQGDNKDEGDKHLNVLFSYVAKDITIPILEAYARGPTRQAAELTLQNHFRGLIQRAEKTMIRFGGKDEESKKAIWALSFIDSEKVKLLWNNLHTHPEFTIWKKALKEKTALKENVPGAASPILEMSSALLATVITYLSLVGGGSDLEYYTEFAQKDGTIEDYDKPVFNQLLTDISEYLIPDIGNWAPAISAVLNFHQLNLLMEPFRWVSGGQRVTEKEDKLHTQKYIKEKRFADIDWTSETGQLITDFNNSLIDDKINFVVTRTKLARRFNNIITQSYFDKPRWKEFESFVTATAPFKRAIMSNDYGLLWFLKRIFKKDILNEDRVDPEYAFRKDKDTFSLPSETLNDTDPRIGTLSAWLIVGSGFAASMVAILLASKVALFAGAIGGIRILGVTVATVVKILIGSDTVAGTIKTGLSETFYGVKKWLTHKFRNIFLRAAISIKELVGNANISEIVEEMRTIISGSMRGYLSGITGSTNRLPFDLMITARFVDLVHRTYVGPYIAMRKDSSDTALASPLKRPNIKTDNETSEEQKNAFRTTINLLSPPLLAFYEYLNLSSDGISDQYYDKYNCYPDRPIPLMIKGRTVRNAHDSIKKEDAQLKWMGMFTTPDFFVYKDPQSFDKVHNTLSDLITESIQAVTTAHQQVLSSDGKGTEDSIITRLTGDRNLSEYKSKLDEILDTFENKLRQENFKGDLQRIEIADRLATEMWVTEKTDLDAGELATRRLKLVNAYAENGKPVREVEKYRSAIYSSLSSTNRYNINVASQYKHTSSKDRLTEFSKVVKSKTPFRTKDSKTHTIFNLQAAINLRHGAMRKSGDIGLLSTVGSYKGRLDRMLTITRLRDRLAKMQSRKYLSKADKTMIDKIFNPSSAAYTDESFKIMRKRLYKSRVDNIRSRMPNSFGLSMPTFKLYIIEKDAKELLFANDFYSYGSVIDISVNASRKRATSVAVIRVSNLYGKLTNVIADRFNVENPFSIEPRDEENLSALLLRPGAMIQVRMGYNAYLGPETIVFSGEVTEIQGTNVLNITAQGWGSQLTRPIGTGSGEDFGWIWNQFPFGSKTYTDLGLISNILDLNKEMNHLGTKSPFLGSTYGNQIKAYQFQNVISRMFKATFVNLVEDVTNIDMAMIDTRLANVNLTADQGFLSSSRRWLVYNETTWDALQDFTLQRPGYKLMVRPFDEEATIIMDNDDGVYQYTLENSASTMRYYPQIKVLQEVARSELASYKKVRELMINERSMLGGYAGVDKGNFYASRPIFRIFSEILAQTIMDINGTPLKGDDLYAKIEDLIDNTGDDTTLEHMTQIAKMSLEDVSAWEASTLNGGVDPMDMEIGESDDDMNKEFGFVSLAISKAVVTTCHILSWQLAAACPGFAPVSASHMKTSSKDIIRNNIKLESGFNRVDLSYMFESFLGWIARYFGAGELLSVAMGTLFGNISLEQIERPSARRNLTVSASPTLEPSALRTYASFQKNAQIRNSASNAYEYVVANSILENLVKDYYGGEIILTMDQSIKPHDTILVYDNVNDMWGMIGVEEVTHRISKETGAITIVVPDVYTSMRRVEGKSILGFGSASIRALSWIGEAVAAVAVMYLGGKILTGVGGLLSRTGAGKSVAGASLKQINKKIANEATEKAVKKLTKELIGKMGSKEGAQAYAKAFAAGLRKTKSTTNQTKSLIAKLEKIATKKYGKLNSVADDIAEAFSYDVGKAKGGKKSYTSALKYVTESLGDTLNIDITEQAAISAVNRTMLANYTSPKIGLLNLFKKNTSIARWGMGMWFGLPIVLLKFGLLHKIGSAVIGKPNWIHGFFTGVGELYFNQKPITLTGLVHKGEPFIGNLEGMKKSDFQGIREALAYRYFKMFEPVQELIGSGEHIVTNALENLKLIGGPDRK